MSEIVAKGSVSFDSFKLFAEAEARAIIQSSQATVPALTSTDAAARQASSASKARLRETFQNIFVKEDLFDLLHQSEPRSRGKRPFEISKGGSLRKGVGIISETMGCPQLHAHCMCTILMHVITLFLTIELL